MPLPSDADIIEDIELAGLVWTLTPENKVKRIAQVMSRVLPLYAGVLARNGADYGQLVKLHVCHLIALPLIGSGVNGKMGVTSASAGEVSVSYGSAGGGIKVEDNLDLTEWGQALKLLRKAQGPFATVGNGPSIRFRD